MDDVDDVDDVGDETDEQSERGRFRHFVALGSIGVLIGLGVEFPKLGGRACGTPMVAARLLILPKSNNVEPADLSPPGMRTTDLTTSPVSSRVTPMVQRGVTWELGVLAIYSAEKRFSTKPHPHIHVHVMSIERIRPAFQKLYYGPWPSRDSTKTHGPYHH